MKLLMEQISNDGSSEVLVRSKLRAVSRRMGFSDIKREHLALVCQEMLTNQVKYAEGTGVIQIWESYQPCHALEFFSLDYGPGITNIPAAMEDDYSSSGTLGKGLGTIQRLSDQSGFFSVPNGLTRDAPWNGMAVWARFNLDDECGDKVRQYDIGQYLRAYHEGPHNGDRVCMNESYGKVRWLHMDGLGHGASAEEVVINKCEILDIQEPLDNLMNVLDGRFRGSCGAVATLGEVDGDGSTASVYGVGDMSTYLVSRGQLKSIPFAPGILGHEHGAIQGCELNFSDQAILITASDGIRRNWDLTSFPGLWRLHPQFIALFLGQVLGRGNDDKSLFVIRKANRI
ncbi:MAG: anti-sigma regulatory factor [Gammaproteobacteria bacterium]|nr:anti-sigma regulatory factor [Gammaproteobacteria bacterium]